MKRPNFGTFGTVAAGAAAMGLCCGIPLLASLGVAGLAAGIGFGSWLLIGGALIVATVAFVRRHRRPQACATPSSNANRSRSNCCVASDTHASPAPAHDLQAATDGDDLR